MMFQKALYRYILEILKYALHMHKTFWKYQLQFFWNQDIHCSHNAVDNNNKSLQNFSLIRGERMTNFRRKKLFILFLKNPKASPSLTH